MDRETTNIAGAVTGGAVAALVSWTKAEDDTQNKLRQNQNDIKEVSAWLRAFAGRGEVRRSKLPVVQDFQAGISSATGQQASPSIIPSNVPQQRPQLAATMEATISAMHWPPVPGVYEDNGMVKSVGEMGVLGSTLSYQEVRAFLQGLLQQETPSPECLVQVGRMANALIAAACRHNLSKAEYEYVWTRLFNAQEHQMLRQISDPHQDPALPPQCMGLVPGLTMVPLTSLGGSVPGYPYANRNTDAKMHYRITTPAAGVEAGTSLAQITFGSGYFYRSADGSLVPFQPSIGIAYAGSIPFVPIGVLHSGCMLMNPQALPGNATLDIHLSVTAG